MKFLPTTKEELAKLGWDRPDIILITGDSYIDSPFIGIAVIGRYLARHGFNVAIIAQPDIFSETDITRLGEPKLFWGVSGGSVGSFRHGHSTGERHWANGTLPRANNPAHIASEKRQ